MNTYSTIDKMGDEMYQLCVHVALAELNDNTTQFTGDTRGESEVIGIRNRNHHEQQERRVITNVND